MSPAIETVGLRKCFGNVVAVDDLDLSVERGEIFGFLGPNGAGKSTTIKIFLDELRPTAGSAHVLGSDAQRDSVAVHKRIGYIPGELRLPSDLTGAQYLDFLTAIRGNTDLNRREELTDRFGLDPSRRLGKLSTGNKQKVGLVQAFMHRPELVLLDEPTRGLDPLVQHDFHDLLVELAAEGTTTFLSSHTLSEVNQVADRVGIIRDGTLVAVDRVAELKRRTRRRIELEFSVPPQLRASDVVGAASIGVAGNVAIVEYDGPVDPVLRSAMAAGTILGIVSQEPDLEDVFLRYYREEQTR